MTALDQLTERQSLLRWIWKQPNPAEFVNARKHPHMLKRRPCNQQVFTNLDVAENFINWMSERGLIFNVERQCSTCGKIHCRR